MRTSKKEEQPIRTGLGTFSRKKFDALTTIREEALDGFRDSLKKADYREVTTSSLVNIAGSCENPNASFTLDYYGREAHLSQSAQIQLEALVLRLKHGFFTINNSFREENYDDPEAKGRRLSEFTLIEPERPYPGLTPDQALERILSEQECIIKETVDRILKTCSAEIRLLGGDTSYLKRVINGEFKRITYSDALAILNQKEGSMSTKEEQRILKHFDNVPTFVTHHLASIKFFNMKRTPDGRFAYSVDLLAPRLGETAGGAVREENGTKIRQQLQESRLGKYLSGKGQDSAAPFSEYFRLFEQENPLLRGGYGIGFERFIAFILNSNDILETIAYRTLRPE